MTSRAVVDARRLRDASGGSAEFEIDLLELLVTDGLERIEALEQALASGDAAAARHQAHTIKGSASSVGAAGLSEAAREAEQQCVAGDLAAVSIDELRAELEQVEDYLRSRRG